MIKKFLNPSGKLTYEEALRQAGERVESLKKASVLVKGVNNSNERARIRNHEKPNVVITGNKKSKKVYNPDNGVIAKAKRKALNAIGISNSDIKRMQSDLVELGILPDGGSNGTNYGVVMPGILDGAPNIKITKANASKITPKQWTAAQDAAIARGDMAEAQRLRDLHFKVSAPNNTSVNKSGDPVRNYHGTTNSFTAFDPQKIGSTTGDTSGFFFTDNKVAGDFYSHETGSAWNNLKLMLGLYKGHKPRIYNVYLNTTNPMITDFHGGVDKVGREVLAKKAVKNGNDANVLQNIIDGPPNLPHNVTIMRNPKHIKSADAVTYDSVTGKRIPLGERDNFNINDMRYGLLPFGIGLTGYGLYNSFNQPLQQSLYYKQGGKMIYKFKKGNKIHIKKANRGKFTDYCGGKVTNECILRGKNSSDPAVRKRATFAANARKWNHKKGGIIVAGDGIKLGNIFSKAQGFLNSDLGKSVINGIGNLYSGIKQSNNLRKQEEQLLKDYNYISKQINTLDVINKTNQLFQELQLQDPNIRVSEIDWRNLYGKNEGIAKQLAQANARNYLVNARQLMMLLNSQSSGGGLDFSGLINAGALLLAGNKNKTNTTTTNTQIPSTATPTYFSSSFDWSKPTLASAIKFST